MHHIKLFSFLKAGYFDSQIINLHVLFANQSLKDSEQEGKGIYEKGIYEKIKVYSDIFVIKAIEILDIIFCY